MRRAAILAALLALAPRPARAEAEEAGCRTRVRLMDPGRACDVSILPLNLGVGYVALLDATTSFHGAVLGVDALTATWGPLFSTLAQMRVALYTVCHEGESTGGSRCGIAADFFVGHAAGWAFHLDADREHQLVLGAALGWGAVGTGWGGRVGGGDGGLVASAFVRYAYVGLIGLEVQALLPVTGDLGEDYPAAVGISVLGLPLLALGFLGR